MVGGRGRWQDTGGQVNVDRSRYGVLDGKRQGTAGEAGRYGGSLYEESTWSARHVVKYELLYSTTTAEPNYHAVDLVLH